jgi:hydrogenase maturation factor HypE
MSKTEIEDGEFHVVQSADGDFFVQTETDAVDLLRSDEIEVSGEGDDVSVVRLNYDGEDWTITSLPWQRIALKLLS